MDGRIERWTDREMDGWRDREVCILGRMDGEREIERCV